MQRLLIALFLPCLLLAAARRASSQTIVCFGDSLTAGYHAPDGQAYPDFLRQDLAADDYHVDIIKMGMDGNTAKEAIDRVPYLLKLKPSIVILEEGGMDGLRGVPVDQIIASMSTMIETFKQHHIKVLLVGIEMPPNLGPDYVKQFDAIYPMLAAKYHLRLVPFMLTNIYDHPDLMSGDGIHPDAAGYRQIASQNILPYLKPMLHK